MGDNFLNEVWGIGKLYINTSFKRKVDSKISSILISVSPKNYDRYYKLESFRKIFKDLGLDLNEYSVQLMQVGIINSILDIEIDIADIKEGLKELAQENIISFENFDYISSFLDSLELPEKFIQKDNLQFHKNLENLNEIYKQLQDFHYKDMQTRAQIAFNNANNSKFYIAITGVINAGKSSMLNALIGKDILGTSNIPETVNLSIISYSEKEFAKVIFWSEDEIKSMGLPILKHINLESKIISLDELRHYTSAQNNISQYVKEIILGINLEILKDGINIVDTPGLDDAVVLREELTKSYMKESDFTIHLMNAAQSATKKDISFIVDTLRNGKSGGLVIGLTHIDKLEQKDRAEVLEYTKRSIETELEEYGFDKDLASNAGYFLISSREKIGISELKRYLYESFFGKDSKKAGMIIDNYKKELSHIIDFISKDYQYSLEIISGDRRNFSHDLEVLQDKNLQISENIKEIQNELNSLYERLDYTQIGAISVLKAIASRLRDRIIGDISYAKNKKQSVNFERAGIIVESGFRDAFIDLFRDFKNKVVDDINSSFEVLKLKLGASENALQLPDIQGYLDKNIPNISYSELNKRVKIAIQNTSSIEKLSIEILDIFENFLYGLNLNERLTNLSRECTKDFIDNINIEIKSMRDILNQKMSEIEGFIKSTKDDIANIENKKLQLQEKIKILSMLRGKIT